MNEHLTAADLIDFENEVVARFKAKEILSPTHLYSNNEEEMIKIFKGIPKDSNICCSWRSHYQALLHGIPREKVMAEILAGHSISLNFPEYNFFSSAIVTGQLSIGVGLALASKIKGDGRKTIIFLGDMTSETGAAHECIKYSIAQKLPVKFIIEDNTFSVCTDTRETWGLDKLTYEGVNNEYVYYYKYKSKYPHAGVGERIQF